MKIHIRLIAILSLIALFAVTAHGSTVDFTGLSGTGTDPVPNGHGGLDWFNFNSLDGTGTAFGGGIVAFNKDGLQATISSSNPFELLGGDITALSPDLLDVNITGYYLGVPVISGDLFIDNTAVYPFSGTPTIVDTVVFQATDFFTGETSGVDAEFALGDLTIASVPEPTTLALFGAGFAALAGTIRRRRRAADR